MRYLPFARPIHIPVYLCDSILAPASRQNAGELPLFDQTITFRTTKGDFIFPVSMQSKVHIDRFTEMVDIALQSGTEPAFFEKQLHKEFKLTTDEIRMLTTIYKQIKQLDEAGENGIWAKYIKNAFAPVYLRKFDYVIGNPPWIRWGYLSEDYRKATLELWQKYGLFSLKGYQTRLGGGEKDFSMLFTYACADNYLNDKGKLGFIITLEVFKSKGAGEGFRGFELKNKGIPLKMLRMEDMVHLQPFSAANKTCVFSMQKGNKTTYPVSTVKWTRKNGIGSLAPELALDEVMKNTVREKMKAQPVDIANPVSSWLTTPPSELNKYLKLQGENAYKALLGARIEPYGVFWLNIKEVRPDNILVVENMHDRGKRKIEKVQVSMEPTLVFPAVSGGHIEKFGVKSYVHVLVTQDPVKRQGYDEDYMMDECSLTHAYLSQFKDILVGRAAYKKYFFRKGRPFAPFYSQFNISELSFSRYRVTWKRMASKMSAVVLSHTRTAFGRKQIISTDTTSFFPVDNKNESHYLCAILNAEIVNNFIGSFSQAGRGFGAPSVMEKLAIPTFNPVDKIHKKLSKLSLEAHNFVKLGRDISGIEKEINAQVIKLWNIKP